MISSVGAIVIFVQDLEGCTRFYRDTLGFPVTFSDDVSIGFKLGTQDFLLLKISAAAKMVGEDVLSPHRETGRHILLCAGVEDVDATYVAFTSKGIAFIKPPVSQAWGRRTAYFADPEGILWEIYHELPAEEQ